MKDSTTPNSKFQHKDNERYEYFRKKALSPDKDKTLINIPKDTDFNMDAVNDTFAKYEYLRISANNPIPIPDPIVSINNIPISTPGNLTVFSGESKSGKSAICGVILSGAIRFDNLLYNGFEGMEIAENTHNKAVLHIDTEQAKHHHHKNLSNAILNRAGRDNEPEYFKSYNIRELDITEYQKVTTDLFDCCFNAFGGIHLAVIDGIGDYIKSVNDEQSANDIVKYFEQLAIKYNCPIIIIIHLNPGSDNKQRGHLGSQLQRKAESVLTVKKDGDICYLAPQLLRSGANSDFPQIQFTYDKEKHYHTYCGIRSKQDKEAMKAADLKALAEQIFTEPLRNKEAVDAIMKGAKCKERTAQDRLKEMLGAEIIIKNDKGLYLINNECVA